MGEDISRFHQEFSGVVTIAQRYNGGNINLRQVATDFYRDNMLPYGFGNHGYDRDEVIDILVQNADTIEFIANLPAASLISRKQAEYGQLSTAVGGPRQHFHTVEGIGQGLLHRSIASVMRVQRLREVTAFTGFRRDAGEPDDQGNGGGGGIAQIFKRPGPLLQNPPNGDKPRWLPAIDLRGEGIFVRLDDSRLSDFASQPDVKKRLDAIHSNIAGSKSLKTALGRPDELAVGLDSLHNPERLARILVAHTFSHLLLRELTLECGYSSASLKERLYLDDGCFGFLIYASSPGADGTRGGLVRMGKLDRLKPVFESTIEKARWCSSDPVCSTCDGQGKEALNMAGCHACALIPETSCELGGHLLGNLLLDRCLVANTAGGSRAGFFDF